MLFISPPFGNLFCSLKLPYTVSIIGTFTVLPRPGKWIQVLKTFRYNRKYGGWTNKIGLRNNGIASVTCKYFDDM